MAADKIDAKGPFRQPAYRQQLNGWDGKNRRVKIVVGQ